jgi:cytochrome c2
VIVNTVVSALLGILFAVLGTVTVFLMFHLWGYPFDKVARKSEAPKGLMLLHRIIGFSFVAVYLVMMVMMVPRLWSYQVEFPPRTVAHICLGVTIGFLLMVKVSIIRFFRHLEEWMPFLGTGILLCTYLLLALSVPFAFKERALRAKALGGDVMSPASLARLARVLPDAGLPAGVPVATLATPEALREGRAVLLTKCVQCHDLKTILTKPRAPRDWVQTVDRMAEKPVYGDTMADHERWVVSAYLIGISPELQQSARKARAQKEQVKEKKIAAVTAMEGVTDAAFDPAAGKQVFEKKCTQCHEVTDTEKHPWKDADEVKVVVERMVDNGLEATPEELDACRKYVTVTYVKTVAKPAATGVAAPAEPAPKDAKEPAPKDAKEPAPKDAKAAKKAPAAAASASAAATASASAGAPTTPATPQEATCGKKGLPDCPMQAWMRGNAAVAASADDGAMVAGVFDRIARLAPPGYGAWAQISNDGAAAARSGDMKAARTACATCHGQYRNKYKAEIRAAPLR